MRHSPLSKFIVVLVVAVIANAPIASATCPTPGCQVGGPPYCNQYIANPMLVHGCGWNKPSTAGYVDLTGTSFLSSDTFVVPAFDTGDLEVYYEVEVIPGSNPGTERLRVEIVSGSFLINVGFFTPSDTGGVFSVPIDDSCKSMPCLLRFRRSSGTSPGDTTFRIQSGFLFSIS